MDIRRANENEKTDPVNTTENANGTEDDVFKFVEDFTSSVSILGVKYVFNKNYGPVRRFIWMVAVLVGIVFLVFHLHDRLDYFFSNPSVIDIEVKYEDFIPFPTVTICNNNRVAKSSLIKHNQTNVAAVLDKAKLGLLDVESEYFKNTSRLLTNWTDFFYRNRHKIETMLVPEVHRVSIGY